MNVVKRLSEILSIPVKSVRTDKRHREIDKKLMVNLERNLALPELRLVRGYIDDCQLSSARQKRLLVTFSASLANDGSAAEAALVAARRITNPYVWLNIWQQGGMLNGGRSRRWFLADIEIEAIRFKRDRPDLWKF